MKTTQKLIPVEEQPKESNRHVENKRIILTSLVLISQYQMKAISDDSEKSLNEYMEAKGKASHDIF